METRRRRRDEPEEASVAAVPAAPAQAYAHGHVGQYAHPGAARESSNLVAPRASRAAGTPAHAAAASNARPAIAAAAASAPSASSPVDMRASKRARRSPSKGDEGASAAAASASVSASPIPLQASQHAEDLQCIVCRELPPCEIYQCASQFLPQAAADAMNDAFHS
jgi:hypothetical protein